jgi:hypothetical protein
MLVNISDAFPLDTLISRPQILKNPHDIYPDTGGKRKWYSQAKKQLN